MTHVRLACVLGAVVQILLVVLAVPALLLTVARLSGSVRLPAVQAQAFAPLAVPLYAALVVLLLGATAFGEHRALALVGAVVALALLGLHVAWVAPLFSADPEPPGERVNVLTANIEFGHADVARLLEVAAKADLVVLEEVTHDALERLEAAGVAETFPHRAGEADESQGTVVLARTPLSGVAAVPGVAKSWAFTWQGLRVLALHPTFPMYIEDWRRDLATIAEVARAEQPDLMLGDLNASLDHRPVRTILAAGYRDAAEQAGSGWQPTWPADASARPFGVPLPPSVAIDHVLVGERLAAVATATYVLGGTDHKALLATLARR